MRVRYPFSPPHDASRVDHVGTYTRSLPVSLTRMYENALDWAHLPHLHGSSFQSIDCEDSGGWGWRAKVVDAKGRASVLELRLDRQRRRWITRNLEGPSLGAEIWTHAFVTAPRALDLVIDFFVPGVAVDDRNKVGRAYARAYETLYDEDVFMMTERQRVIDLRLDGIRRDATLTLPIPPSEALPLVVDLSNRPFILNRYEDDWVIYPAMCPHQLGPLTGDVDDQGRVHCPWHGYAFDVRSGECVTGAGCRFGERPVVDVDDGTMTLRWSGEDSAGSISRR